MFHKLLIAFLSSVSNALRHATMSWYYITAGLVLYALDNAVRLSTTVATLVTLEQLAIQVRDIDDHSPSSSVHSSTATHLSLETATTGVVKLAYTVASPLMDTKERKPLTCLMGQYVYINIPSISSLEWHPFTISSSPLDSVTTHHIKVMGGLGGNQWTAKLYQLAKTIEVAPFRDEEQNSVSARCCSKNAEEKSVPFIGRSVINGGTRFPSITYPSFSNILVNVDGPYGLSVCYELHRYTHILLVGGGIGVTPLHSCLRHLYLSDKCATTDNNDVNERRVANDDVRLPFSYPNLQQVRLLWSVKSEAEAAMFKSTVRRS